ncbi:MAG TPA: tetratricopeptide repeat protein [Balneolaceae bacterium]|nr:tetratricopeptide repeat protein [Balneolaceae bacterium]
MKIHRLPLSDPQKFGPKRAQTRRNRTLEKHGQLNLFSGRILQMESSAPFDEALRLDESGDYSSAQRFYLKAIEMEDSMADAYCNLGIIAFRDQNYAKAIDYLTLCLRYDHRHYEAHFNLANIYAEIGNAPLAQIHYEVSIEMEPTFSNSYFNLALILVKIHEYSEAISRLKEYVQIAPATEHKPALELISKLSNL